MIKRKTFVVSFTFSFFLLCPPLALWNVSSENIVGSWKKSLEYVPCREEEPESYLENTFTGFTLKNWQEMHIYIYFNVIYLWESPASRLVHTLWWKIQDSGRWGRRTKMGLCTLKCSLWLQKTNGLIKSMLETDS